MPVAELVTMRVMVLAVTETVPEIVPLELTTSIWSAVQVAGTPGWLSAWASSSSFVRQTSA